MSLRDMKIDKSRWTCGVTHWFKKQKARVERRRAKRQPDCLARYGRYWNRAGYFD